MKSAIFFTGLVVASAITGNTKPALDKDVKLDSKLDAKFDSVNSQKNESVTQKPGANERLQVEDIPQRNDDLTGQEFDQVPDQVNDQESKQQSKRGSESQNKKQELEPELVSKQPEPLQESDLKLNSKQEAELDSKQEPELKSKGQDNSIVSASSLRKILTGDFSAEIPHVPKFVSEFVLDSSLKIVKSSILNFVDQQIKNQAAIRTKNSLARKLTTFFNQPEAPNKLFTKINAVLTADPEAKANVQSLLSLTDNALNGDFMDFSANLMRQIRKDDPKIAEGIISGIKSLQETQSLFQPKTYKTFMRKVTEN